jgi:phosphoribosylanthranilate isomerase
MAGRGESGMIVQIYSMTSVADAVATAAAGADLIGVVVAEPGIVPEGINAEAARAVLAAVRPRARGVALSLSDDRDEICAMVDAVRPDIVHIAAREIEPEVCAWIRKRIAPVMLLRAIAVRAGETLTEADAHQECADFLMLDSGAKNLPSLGATGETHDWSVSRTIVERSRIPGDPGGRTIGGQRRGCNRCGEAVGCRFVHAYRRAGASGKERSGESARLCRRGAARFCGDDRVGSD